MGDKARVYGKVMRGASAAWTNAIPGWAREGVGAGVPQAADTRMAPINAVNRISA